MSISQLCDKNCEDIDSHVDISDTTSKMSINNTNQIPNEWVVRPIVICRSKRNNLLTTSKQDQEETKQKATPTNVDSTFKTQYS